MGWRVSAEAPAGQPLYGGLGRQLEGGAVEVKSIPIRSPPSSQIPIARCSREKGGDPG